MQIQKSNRQHQLLQNLYWRTTFASSAIRVLVVSSIFRTFDLPSYSGGLLVFGCFASGPHWGQKQSGQAMAAISSICTTSPGTVFIPPVGSNPASMVGSIVPASEVSLLLLVPTSKE
jgi:hypothetical protein